MLNRRLQHSLQQTFPAATLISLFSTRPLLCLSLKQKMPVKSQNMLVYSFTCSCATQYIVCTTRHLKAHINVYHTAWLRSGDSKSTRSAVVAHIVGSGLAVNPWWVFPSILQSASQCATVDPDALHYHCWGCGNSSAWSRPLPSKLLHSGAPIVLAPQSSTNHASEPFCNVDPSCC